MSDVMLVAARARALETLGRLDVRLETALGHAPESLDPGRSRITPLRQLGEQLLAEESAPHVVGAFAQAMETIVEAQIHNFPENIFWDFDYMAGCLLRDGQRWPQGVVDYLRKVSLVMARLQHMFGCHSAIRFRYVHDFVYGFDWARWAAVDEPHRGRIGPFDMRFLRYVLHRGEEIVKLTEQDAANYPAIDAQQWRNVFAFRRDPDAERALLRDLAARSMIPVMAWLIDPPAPKPGMHFAAERAARASALALQIA